VQVFINTSVSHIFSLKSHLGKYLIMDASESIFGIYKESWHKIRGIKLPIFLLYFLLASIFMSSAMFTRHSQLGAYFLLGIWVVSSIIAGFIQLTIFILALRRSLGIPATVSLAFKDCWRTKGNVLVVIIVRLLIFLCMQKLFFSIFSNSLIKFSVRLGVGVVSLYCYSLIEVFILPLLATKKASLKIALPQALKGFHRNIVTVMLNYGLVTILSVISVGLLLPVIWVLPWNNMTLAIIFRNSMGMQQKIKPQPVIQVDESVPVEIPVTEQDNPPSSNLT
jgi:hypothetical protein